MREDFDYSCECGYYKCKECGEVWYPMEMDWDQQPYDGGPPMCPNCAGDCEFKQPRQGQKEGER